METQNSRHNTGGEHPQFPVEFLAIVTPSVVDTFPDGNSALMLVYARLRHVVGTHRGNKKHMNMNHLEVALEGASIAG